MRFQEKSKSVIDIQEKMVSTAESYHTPVMLNESVDALNIKPGGIYVDATFGGGGHSKEILARLNGNGRLFGFDQDADTEANIPKLEKESAEEFTFVCSNFRYLKNWMMYYGIEHIDGLLADLGVSSHHFDDKTRGFSFRFNDAPLDMRMNNRAGRTAADVLNTYDEEALADMFYVYGELRNAKRIAAAIVGSRTRRSIRTSGDLKDLVEQFFKTERANKDMARLFQALRIEVNNEMQALCELLRASVELLAPGGRLSVITYHSLEDRMVKNIMKTGNIEGKVKQDFYGRIESPLHLVNNKVIIPTDSEQNENPRSRSAKLRIAEKKAK